MVREPNLPLSITAVASWTSMSVIYLLLLVFWTPHTRLDEAGLRSKSPGAFHQGATTEDRRGNCFARCGPCFVPLSTRDLYTPGCTPRGSDRPVTPPRQVSPAQTEALDQRAVAVDVHLGQVVQQTAATADHQQKTTAGVVVVLVLLEVLREVGDALAQQGDLRLGRAGVAVVQTVLTEDGLLLLRGQCH